MSKTFGVWAKLSARAFRAALSLALRPYPENFMIHFTHHSQHCLALV